MNEEPGIEWLFKFLALERVRARHKALKKILHHSLLQDGHLGSIYCLVHLFLHQALTHDNVVCASCNSLGSFILKMPLISNTEATASETYKLKKKSWDRVI